jgi:hypothetical protein
MLVFISLFFPSKGIFRTTMHKLSVLNPPDIELPSEICESVSRGEEGRGEREGGERERTVRTQSAGTSENCELVGRGEWRVDSVGRKAGARRREGGGRGEKTFKKDLIFCSASSQPLSR